MKLKFITCAVSALLDQATQNISIISILESVQTPIFPSALAFTVVANFLRQREEPATAKVKFSLKIDNDTLMEHVFSLEFQGKLSTRLIAQVGPIPIPRPGILKSEIWSGKKLLGGWPIKVEKAGDEMFLGSSSGSASSVSSTRRTKVAKKAKKKKAK